MITKVESVCSDVWEMIKLKTIEKSYLIFNRN